MVQKCLGVDVDMTWACAAFDADLIFLITLFLPLSGPCLAIETVSYVDECISY